MKTHLFFCLFGEDSSNIRSAAGLDPGHALTACALHRAKICLKTQEEMLHVCELDVKLNIFTVVLGVLLKNGGDEVQCGSCLRDCPSMMPQKCHFCHSHVSFWTRTKMSRRI
jgi:hypothetical protein